MNKKFSKEELQRCAYDDSFDLESVERKMIGSSRWSIHYDMVFNDNETGRYFKTNYSKGATECQEERPFEDGPDEILCEEVVEKEVMVKKWVLKEEKENV